MTKVATPEKPFLVQPYSRKELSVLMKITEYVLSVWVKSIDPEIGKPKAGLYSANQVKAIIETYGISHQLKPSSKKELSAMMKVSEYIMGAWIKDIEHLVGKPKAGLYSVNQIKKIIDIYGMPDQSILIVED